MKRCFAYIRVSTAKQGERGSSLQEQRSAIEAYALKHNLSIASWFIEMETAAKQGRQEFGKLISQLRKGKATGLLVHKIDRSARNLKDWAQINDLMDLGVDIHFAHESLDLATRGGRLAADIQAVVAADYIRNLRDEVRKGFYGRLKQGYYPLPAPRGYLDRGAAKAKVIDPIEGPLIRAAFELYGTGQLGLEALRHEMWQQGLRSNQNTPLSADAMARVLRNPFYIGLIRIRRTNELFEGLHEPLVGKNLFERVQAVMDGRVFARPQAHEFAFRRIFRCTTCRRTLTGEKQKGHIYYRCHGRRCLGTSHRQTDLDERVRQELAALQWDDGEFEDFNNIIGELIEDERKGERARVSKVERDLVTISSKLQRLTDLLIEEAIDRTTYQERREGLLLQRQALKELLRDDTEGFWERVRRKFERGKTALDQYISAPAAGRREILTSLCSSLDATGKDIVITMEFPLEQLRDWRREANSGPSQAHVRKSATLRREEIAAFIASLVHAAEHDSYKDAASGQQDH